MEQLLWTFDDIVRFIDHPDTPVRRWSLDRLIKLFPDRAADPLLTMVDDPNSSIALSATEFLSRTGNGEKYGPVLMDRLKRAQGSRFGYLAEALARLDIRDALPVALHRLETIWRHKASIDMNEFLRIVNALGTFGGDEARQALWPIMSVFSQDHMWAGAVMTALLDTAQPEDIDRLVQTYHSWPSEDRFDRELGAFASPVGVGRLTQEIRYQIKNGLGASLKRAALWLGQEPSLSEDCTHNLDIAFGSLYRSGFEVLHYEARDIVSGRGDDIEGWQAAWEAGERPLGYRRRALFTLLTLDAFAAHLSSSQAQRAQEISLCLALVCQLSIDENDAANLKAAETETETLLDILAANRQNVLPDIIDRVAALGPKIVPQLIDRFDPESSSWGPIRIADAICNIARRHPESCDPAIPALVEAISDEQGSYLLESCSRALEAIGPAAVPSVAEHVRDDDHARQIYLLGVLGEIPTERSAQAILSYAAGDDIIDEIYLSNLADTGSPSAIEPLYAYWDDYQDHLLAESLLVLCELNGVQKPELPEWRRISQEQEARFAASIGERMPLVAGSRTNARSASRQRQSSQGRSVRRPKAVSKRERKKRAAQRKGRQRGKRRKR